ncbi:MAG: GlsB/YeaQ/YmgE family stress response membrane protein [Candidatus Acidiferrales bacterium]
MLWLLWTVLIGIFAGFLAGHVVRGRGFGVLMDLIVGIVGSILGGWLFSLIGLAAYGLIGRLFTAFVGALILLLLVRALKRK